MPAEPIFPGKGAASVEDARSLPRQSTAACPPHPRVTEGPAKRRARCPLCHGREWVPGCNEFNREGAPFPCPMCPAVVRAEGGTPEPLTDAERAVSWSALRGTLYGWPIPDDSSTSEETGRG